MIGHFADKRKRAGRAHIAFDDLDRIVLGDELDVEGAGDVQGFDDIARDFFCAADRF